MSEQQQQTPSDGTPTPNPTPEPTPSPTPQPEPSLLNQDDPPKPEPAAAPEKYEDFKLPDGVKLEAEGLTAAQALFKKHNLTQEAAQEMVDFYAKQVGASVTASDAAADEMVNGWMDQAKNHPELAGKLPKIKENLGKMYDVLINAVPEKAAETRQLVAEFKEAMNLTGVGSHPAFIRLLSRLAERVIEPGHVAGAKPSPAGQGQVSGNPGLAASMYPSKS